MSLSALTAISPIDGRYHGATKELGNYFSEYALIRYRVFIEIEYFIALSKSGIPQLQALTNAKEEELRAIYRSFSLEDAEWIKNKEKETNHDVKAVEYFVKNKFHDLGLGDAIEFIHFGLTSQDINNTAIPYTWKLALNEVYIPLLTRVIETLERFAEEWKEVPLLARTHGQPASPTRLGKEIYVFVERLTRIMSRIQALTGWLLAMNLLMNN
jgi:adenylosuccinate lyase